MDRSGDSLSRRDRGEVEELGPIVVAGVLDELGVVGATGEDGGNRVVPLEEIFVEEGRSPVGIRLAFQAAAASFVLALNRGL